MKQEQEGLTELVEIDDETAFILHPGEFVLGSTLERVKLPDDLVARLEGKSSLGRLGLLIHSTAGFIDPGWDGHVTLELSNVANLRSRSTSGRRSGNCRSSSCPSRRRSPTAQAGSARSTRAKGPTPSRYWKNFEP